MRRRKLHRRPRVELLEPRQMLAADDLIGGATPVAFERGGDLVVSDEIAPGGDVDLYQLDLADDDEVALTIDAQSLGSNLNSFLRVFRADGTLLEGNENDDDFGRPLPPDYTSFTTDSFLSFRPGEAGLFFVGVSDSMNNAYDPTTLDGRVDSGTSGIYNLAIRVRDFTGTLGEIPPPLESLSSEPIEIPGRIAHGLDVDFFRADVASGASLAFRFAAPAEGNLLSPAIRAFDRNARELPLRSEQLGDGGMAFRFTAPIGDFFYVGVSDSGNLAYDPFAELSGTAGQTGDYVMSVQLADPPGQIPESEPNDAGQANAVSIGVPVAGQIFVSTDQDQFRVTLTRPGLLTVSTTAAAGGSLSPRLTLEGFATSDRSAVGAGASISQFLPTGDYVLTVRGASGTAGGYELLTSFTAATPPGESAAVGALPVGGVSADFNGDGIPDLALANEGSFDIQVLLGIGGGAFAPPVSAIAPTSPVQLPGPPSAIATADLNGDGRQDLVATIGFAGMLVVLLGQDGGLFAEPLVYPTFGETGPSFTPLTRPTAVAVADFSGDGLLDVAVADAEPGAERVKILLRDADGNYAPSGVELPVGADPTVLVARDLSGDGRADLIVVNRNRTAEGAPEPAGPGSLIVFLATGDGQFESLPALAVGDEPASLAIADFDEDGVLDLAVANARSDDVSLLTGKVGGEFSTEVRVDIRLAPSLLVAGDFTSAIVAGDFNGDGHADLAVTHSADRAARVAFGRGDGTFGRARSVLVPVEPRFMLAGDWNGDARLDLAAVSGPATAVSIRLGTGDGQFQAPQRFGTGFTPSALAVFDANSDGRPDLAVGNSGDAQNGGDASLLLGVGDGGFLSESRVGQVAAHAIVAGDFNADGRPDLAMAHGNDGEPGFVSVQFGLGDGTYQVATHYSVGQLPLALAAGDFNGDGLVDLATSNFNDASVSVLLGELGGAFRPALGFASGAQPLGLSAADFNADGLADLAVANSAAGEGSVAILFGDRFESLTGHRAIAVGTSPVSLAAGDFDGDGDLDLAVADQTDDKVTLLVNSAGTFAAAPLDPLAVGDVDDFAQLVAAADFNLDGQADLAVANSISGDVSILLGSGGGQFSAEFRLAVGIEPSAIAVSDLNGDGRADLALSRAQGNDIVVFLGTGTGQFLTPEAFAAAGVDSTPILADLSGDGTPDLAVLDAAGNILVRLGRPGQSGDMAAPRVVNPDAPARALALVQVGGTPRLAALDRQSDSISIYAIGAGGAALNVQRFAVAAQPARLRVADVNGDGHQDVLAASTDGAISILVANAVGGFDAPRFASAGGPTADLAALDLTGDGLLEFITADPAAGTIRVARRNAAGQVLSSDDFVAGTSLPGFRNVPESVTARFTLDGTSTIISGDFNRDGFVDLIAVNPSASSLAFLAGTPGGGLANPRAIPVHDRPTIVRAADFNRDGNLDLAALSPTAGKIELLIGAGDGTFTFAVAISAGNAPAGLAVADGDFDGIVDLLVGNQYGDVMTLPGRGDGSFDPFVRANRRVALAVGDMNGDGQDDWVVANEARDRISLVQDAQPGNPQQVPGEGIAAPGAVKAADLDGDRILDMVVANSGGNEVLVYLGLGGGQFDAAQHFYAGANPVDVSVGDVNGDGRLDVIATNEGSNDLSVLLGDVQSLLRPGVRLDVAAGPVSSQVADFNSDGLADLVVTSAGSNQVTVLPGIGNGFFNDASPLVFATGISPQQTFVGNFDGNDGLDLVTLNFGSNSLTFYSGFDGSARADMASGGIGPLGGAVGDVDGNGSLDLLVGNNVDGGLALFLGGRDGFALSDTFFSPDVQNPTALALANVGEEGQLGLLVANEGEDSVAVFSGEVLLAATDSTPSNVQESALSGSLFDALANTAFEVGAGGFGAVLQSVLGVAVTLVGDLTTDNGGEGGDDGGGSRGVEAAQLWNRIDALAQAGWQIVESTVRSLHGRRRTRAPGDDAPPILSELLDLLAPGITLETLQRVVEEMARAQRKSQPKSNDSTRDDHAAATDAALADEKFDPSASDVAANGSEQSRTVPRVAQKPAAMKPAKPATAGDEPKENAADPGKKVDSRNDPPPTLPGGEKQHGWTEYAAWAAAAVLATGAAGYFGYNWSRRKRPLTGEP